MKNIITSEVVIAYTHCKHKAYLLLCTNKKGIPHEYISNLADEARKNREEYIPRIKLKTSEILSYSSERFKLGNSIIVGAHLKFDDLRAYSDVLTKIEETSSTNQTNYTPTLVVGTHKISKAQRLQLAFIGYVLSKCQNKKPASGKIVGVGNKAHTIKLNNLYNEIEVVINKLRTWTSSQKPESPPVILNKHCLSCPFQQKCETEAKEHDHLSLLRGMTEREITVQNKKGIFTVNQFSYTYRPRKRKKNKGKHNLKYHHSLRALAIRDHKIYIVQKPKVPLSETLIFLDVEGIPDQSFYYLIGIVVVSGPSIQNFSFWADTKKDEKKIWKEFLLVVNRYHECTVFHYGSYEAKFIETMRKRYTEDDGELFKKFDANLVNTLSLMYAKIYFPTYSASLKDIGAYLGQKWSEEHATGLQSLVWRHKWETSGDASFKKRLIQYNLEDCLALKAFTEALIAISNEHTASNRTDIASIDDIEVETPFTFGNTQYLFKELEFVNKCAYFDYQREKIYLRTNKNIQKAIKHQKKGLKYANKVDKTVSQIPRRCPNCNRHTADKYIQCNKIVFDLKFMKNGIKKWVVEYEGARCHLCGKMITAKNRNVVLKKYGHNLLAWSINQYITYRIPLNTISHIILESFRIKINDNCIYKFRETLSKAYQETYKEIRQTVIQGNLIHVDETDATVRGFSSSYVWVFTNMNSVFYTFKPNRESGFLKDLLKGFEGVMISDFYGGYDAIECAQQKCLIHLIRDLNADLLKNQFDTEFKEIVCEFGKLLRTIIGTVDTYGLKKRHLAKHNKDVQKYYKKIFNADYKSELAMGYQKRFLKNREKLFTFLNYDNIPWNNNNAEHAIKPFAKFRRDSKRLLTEKTITEYLILLSIQQTCKYRGISFLEFLRSREKSIKDYSRTLQ